MKLDYLFFGAHPDDVELSCGGVILKLSKEKKIGIIDLTEGELGSRGSVKTRYAESIKANKIMGIAVRENLKMPDGFLVNNTKNLLQIITAIRKYQPNIIFANSPKDRHPDHVTNSKMIADATFLSGLIKIKTGNLKPWRPDNLFFYIQDTQIEPDFIIDITQQHKQKIKVIASYETQFYKAGKTNSTETKTYISTPLFWDNLEAKSRMMGQKIGVKYGEGYICHQKLGFENFDCFLKNLN